MDPNKNVERQRELATAMGEIASTSPGDSWAETDMDVLEHFAELSIELCELVVALDEWRRRGGYDPYAIGIVWTGE
jgi:hypothetical protein